jgi:hypothetical protein
MTSEARPASEPVGTETGIRKLEWTSEPPYSVARVSKLRLLYSTECVWDDGKFLYCILSGGCVNQQFATLDEARAAAQADFESRIRSALVPAVAAEVEVKALEWKGGLAETPFCAYRAEPVEDDTGPHWQVTIHQRGSVYSRHASEIAAAQFAQSDYEARIRSALVPASAISERERKLREALQDIARQPLSTEPSGDADDEELDFTGGYDLCIKRARAALSEAP